MTCRSPAACWIVVVAALAAAAPSRALASRVPTLRGGACTPWTAPLHRGVVAPQTEAKVLVVYYSQSGNTERLAKVVAEGARRVDGVSVTLKAVADVTREDLVEADGLVLGSPTYYANIAGPMKSFIDDWAFRYGVYLGGKVGGAFSTGGGDTGGKEHVVVSLLLAMMNNGMVVAGPTHEEAEVKFGYPGASALTPTPGSDFSAAELENARLLGERIARLALKVEP